MTQPRTQPPAQPCVQCQASITLAGVITAAATYATVKAAGAVWRRLR